MNDPMVVMHSCMPFCSTNLGSVGTLELRYNTTVAQRTRSTAVCTAGNCSSMQQTRQGTVSGL